MPGFFHGPQYKGGVILIDFLRVIRGASMVQIKGFDKIQRELSELSNALNDLSGSLGTVSFNPNDPQSIDIAIQEIERAIDEKVAPYNHNSMVASIIEKMKEAYRQKILDRADAARLGRGGEEDEEAN